MSRPRLHGVGSLEEALHLDDLADNRYSSEHESTTTHHTHLPPQGQSPAAYSTSSADEEMSSADEKEHQEVVRASEAMLTPILSGRNKWRHRENGKDPLINGDYCLSVDGRYVFAVCYHDPEMREANPHPGLYVCDMWNGGAKGTYDVPELPESTVLGFTEYATGEALLMTKRILPTSNHRESGRSRRIPAPDPEGFDLYKVQIDHDRHILSNPRVFKSFVRPATNAVVTWWGSEVFFLFFTPDKSSCRLHWLSPLKGQFSEQNVTFPYGVIASDDCLFTNNGKIYLFSVMTARDREPCRSDQLISIDFQHGFKVAVETMTPDPIVGKFPRRFGDICIESQGRLFAFCTDPNTPPQDGIPDASCWTLDLNNYTWQMWRHTALYFRYQPIVWLAVTNQGKGILLRQGYKDAEDDEVITRLHSFWITPPSLKCSAWDTALRAASRTDNRHKLLEEFGRFV